LRKEVLGEFLGNLASIASFGVETIHPNWFKEWNHSGFTIVLQRGRFA